jgi:hypothetical protein
MALACSMMAAPVVAMSVMAPARSMAWGARAPKLAAAVL